MLVPSDGDEIRKAALRALREDLATVEHHVMLGFSDDGRLERLRRIIAKLEKPEAKVRLTAVFEAL